MSRRPGLLWFPGGHSGTGKPRWSARPRVAAEAFSLVATVFAAVFHAEIVAHRVGGPFGTLVLALAVTIIEVALIVSLMILGGAEKAELARDTVFAAVMIVLNGIVGLGLLVEGSAIASSPFNYRAQMLPSRS